MNYCDLWCACVCVVRFGSVRVVFWWMGVLAQGEDRLDKPPPPPATTNTNPPPPLTQTTHPSIHTHPHPHPPTPTCPAASQNLMRVAGVFPAGSMMSTGAANSWWALSASVAVSAAAPPGPGCACVCREGLVCKGCVGVIGWNVLVFAGPIKQGVVLVAPSTYSIHVHTSVSGRAAALRRKLTRTSMRILLFVVG